MATLEELKIEATAEIEAAKPQYISVNNEKRERTEAEYAQAVTDLTNLKWQKQEYGYQRDRVYPPLGEQFDKLWHDINNGTLDNTGEFFTALKEVKDNNPKPGA